MTPYWRAELARRAAAYYEVSIDELVVPIVAHRCGGNPFYITAVTRQAAKQGKLIDSEETINALLVVDLSSGFIWAEFSDQVTRWIRRINEYRITKWVLYLSALEESECIEPAHIQQQLEAKEGKIVSIDTIRDVLIRLSRGNLLEYYVAKGFLARCQAILLILRNSWYNHSGSAFSICQALFRSARNSG